MNYMGDFFFPVIIGTKIEVVVNLNFERIKISVTNNRQHKKKQKDI